MASCVAPQKIELKNAGDCPHNISEGKRLIVEGFFGINPEEGVATTAGSEARHPSAKLAFCNQPGGDCSFQVTLVMARDGDNGPDVANRTLYNDYTHPHYHIYDSKGQEIDFNDRVRVTGTLVESCRLKVEKIEKL
jgi:hypothetical protein